MRIIEVRDRYIKLETVQKIGLTSFLLIEDEMKTYLAQVIQVKKAGEYSIAYAKIMFLYNNGLIDYDNSLPSMTSEVKIFDTDDFNNLLSLKNPIAIGKSNDEKSYICLDKNNFDKNTLVVIDSKEKTNSLLSNLNKQITPSILIDMLGIVDGEKFIAGKDFKLPLNTDSLQFIF